MVDIDRLFGLKGKIAVVAGGAGLIGSKISEVLAIAGATVIIVDTAKESQKVAEDLSQKTNSKAIHELVDITNKQAVTELAIKVKDKFGKCDILVNSVHYKGGAFFTDLSKYPIESWEKVLSVNLTGTFLMCQAFGSMMFEGDGGSIVNISSTYGLVSADPRIYGKSGINSPVSYAATKSAILNLSRYLAIHWRPKVRVNVLAPGGVEVDQDPQFIKNYCSRTPLGRMAKAEDYQGAILFMCSDASKYMTGSVVVVDGGWTAW